MAGNQSTEFPARSRGENSVNVSTDLFSEKSFSSCGCCCCCFFPCGVVVVVVVVAVVVVVLGVLSP